ncbi:hypothetical protein CAEBREN_20627 [Caenorhabditis brenneri]|uniref:C2H2-type domain-containing protein n=1 Tax=Caenorhabditis brenneri TaxID=135651 RepID=G0MYM3_CAEBE|nr:hypothetical protein CAEBREN_20627 [Caenorhabditis brenneri]
MTTWELGLCLQAKCSIYNLHFISRYFWLTCIENMSTFSSSEDERDRRNRKHSNKRSDNTRNRSRSPISRRKSSKHRASRSSSRGTFDDIDDLQILSQPPTSNRQRSNSPVYYSCQLCRRTFEAVRELAEHEVKDHKAAITCYHCDNKADSVERSASHTKYRHGPKPVICAYCQEPFGKSSELMTECDWEEFRSHMFKEAVKKQMFKHGVGTVNGQMAVALRGVGACPHGPPVKCKNFPQCPGSKCIYSHNMCRYENTCNKSTCPFDHPNRPRTCMTCVNDMKLRKNMRH